MTCGRRWRDGAPRCPHPKRPDESDNSYETPAPPSEVDGYRIEHLLGTGGFGTVVAATRQRDGRQVAIKTVHREDPISCGRLEREAEALRVIGSPFVPDLYDIGALPDGTPYLVLERLMIPSLDRKLGDPMKRGEFGALINPILTAVQNTHQRGFVHRDLKPENIFVSGSLFTARLIDFGLTKSLTPSSTLPSDTLTGTLLGTPIYMSPEQCEGKTDVDQRIDIYALGVIMYEMLTGRPPFIGKSGAIRDAHIHHRPTPPSRVAPVSPSFDEVILRCLAKTPDRRFDEVRALRQSLSSAMERESEVIRFPAAPVSRAVFSGPSQLVGLILFFSAVGTGTIHDTVAGLGGQVIFVEGSRYVVAFGLDTSGNPIGRAFDSAQALIEQGLATRVVVERDRVKIHQSPAGTKRVLSAAFRDLSSFPQATDPSGVLVSEGAIDGLGPMHMMAVPGRQGLRRAIPHSFGEQTRPGSGPLIGRDRQLTRLIESARHAVSHGLPAITTVTAEIGYGKSHLAEALVTQLRRALPEVLVLEFCAREPRGVEHDQLLQHLLRVALNLPEIAPDDGGRHTLTQHLGHALAAEVWPAVALVLGWLPAHAPEVLKLSAAPSALRSAAAQAAGEALRRLAASRPVCCVIDDAHYADEITLDALEFATLAESEAPLWVCVLAEPIFHRARPTWATRAGRTHAMDLPPLPADKAALLCRQMLHPAKNVPEQVIERLVDSTRGSPLLLTELIRGLKRNGLVRRHARGDSWYLATDELDELPELPQIEWLAEREIAALSDELAASVRLMSLLGPEFTVLEVEGLLRELEEDGLGDTFPLDAWVSISRLLGQGLLASRHDGHFEFRHVLIRDLVVRSAPAELRYQIHRAAFRYYRNAPGLSTRYRLRQLAWHAEHSGLLGAAAATYIHLAEEAQNRHEYLDAELLYSRAIELMPDDNSPARMKCYNGRGLMHYRLSRFADALNDIDRARSIAKQLGDIEAQIQLLLDQATVLDWMNDYQRSRALIEEARKLAERESSELIEARLSRAMGTAYFRARESEKAKQLLQNAVERSEELGDLGYEPLVISLLMLGLIFSFELDVDQAKAVFDRAIEISEERGDKLHLAAALNNRRELWMTTKQVDRAAQDGLRAQRIGRELGQSEVEYAIAYNLAELYYYAGDLPKAWPHIRRAVEIEPNNSTRPLAQLLYARLLLYDDRRDEARRVIARIDALLDSADGHDDASFSDSEQIQCEMIEFTLLSAERADWDELYGRGKPVLRAEERVELLEFMALGALERGDREAATAALREAVDESVRASHIIEDRVRAKLAGIAVT